MRKGISTCGIGSVTSKVPVHPAVTLKHMPQQKGTKLRALPCSCRIGRRGRRERSIKSVLLIATINRTFQPLVQPPGCATESGCRKKNSPCLPNACTRRIFACAMRRCNRECSCSVGCGTSRDCAMRLLSSAERLCTGTGLRLSSILSAGSAQGLRRRQLLRHLRRARYGKIR